MIRVQCSGCKLGLKIKPTFAGKKVKCPRCRAGLLVVPTRSYVPKSRAAAWDEPPPDHVGRYLLWAGVVLLAGLAVGGLGWQLHSSRPGVDNPVALAGPAAQTEEAVKDDAGQPKITPPANAPEQPLRLSPETRARWNESGGDLESGR
jgi:hypothetical protein